MKKILLLVFVSMITFCGMAQKTSAVITNEQVRFALANGMANLVTTVKPLYAKGQTQQSFITKVLGTAKPTKEGNAVLAKAYDYIIKGTSFETIVQSYNGQEMAAAIKYLKPIYDKNPTGDGAEIFGLKSSTVSREAAATECKWYQLWCHLKNFAGWVVDNWPKIEPIIIFLISVL